MEDVLEVYKRPFDPLYPVVCLDESSKQQVKEVRSPIPMEPDKPERFDTEYERNGVSNLFMVFEPLTGWRHVEITNHLTAIDWAHQVKFLADVRYKAAKEVVLIGEQSSTSPGNKTLMTTTLHSLQKNYADTVMYDYHADTQKKHLIIYEGNRWVRTIKYRL